MTSFRRQLSIACLGLLLGIGSAVVATGGVPSFGAAASAAPAR